VKIVMLGIRRFCLLALLSINLTALAVPVLGQGGGADEPVGRAEKLQGKLDTFCTKWMGFLDERERNNRAKIAWRAVPSGVEGEFVGYDNKYECKLSALHPDTKVPVGTIKYLEFKYRHKGASSSKALVNRGKIIEATEVTEIFRYSKNKWIY